MKKNKKAFSLAIAMGLVLITSLLAYTILEYMIPFSRNVRGIENSTSAYYSSNKGIELGLYFLNDRNDNELKKSTSKNYLANSQFDFSLDTSVVGGTIPEPGNGTSYFDNDRNQVLVGNPIQLSVGYNYLSSKNLDIQFRVPDINNNGLNDENLFHEDGNNTGIVNWQLSSSSDTLNSHSGSLITLTHINNDSEIDVFSREGRKLDGTFQNFETFYDNNCTGTANECILKFSVINKLETSNSGVPYLEWIIQAGNEIPLRYSRIVAEGKSYGFIKQIEVKVAQETVSEAFDFTVFQ